MKFVSALVSTALLCLLLQYFLPWWCVAAGALIVGFLFDQTSLPSFVAGGLGAGILWAIAAELNILSTHAILSGKVDQLLPVPAIVMATLIAFIVGGFAGITGSLLRKIK